MTARLPLKIGSSDAKGDDVTHFQKWAKANFPSYFAILGDIDGYFGTSDSNFVKEMQTRLVKQGKSLVINGIFDALTASLVGYKGGVGTGGAVDTGKRRQGAWCYNMPGSGADYSVGPAHQVAVHADKVHGFRDQGVEFAQGGYLGFMGGDSKLSYVESNDDMKKSLYWLHDNNPDLQALLAQLNAGKQATVDLDLTYWAYSKSADGLEDWLEEAYGPGGRYERARGWIRIVGNFGNPSKQPDKDGGSRGWNPPGWGIARKRRSQWLKDKTVSITNPMDFYACVPDSDKIRPTFYGEIIHAEAELPYFVHILNIAIPAILKSVPIFGGFLGPLSPMVNMAIPMITGLASSGLLTNLIGQSQASGQHTEVDEQLIEMMTPMGLLSNAPALIGLIAALPGLQNHGAYHLPFPELNNRSGEQVGRDLMDLVAARKI